MALFFTKENPTEIVAIFDIGNGTVTGALVEMVRGAKPTILFLAKSKIISNEESFASLFSATTKAIEFVGHKLLDAKRGAPSQIFCFLSTPWYSGQTRVIKMIKSTPFIFTKKLWQGMVDKELKRFTDENMIEGTDVVLIENRNMSVILNGQESMNPVDKKVNGVELSVFFSVSSANILESFRNSINRSFSLAPIRFNSFLFTSFITIRDVFLEDASDSLIIDIGSRVTELARVERDTIVSSASFPRGVGGIKDSIQKTFGISNSEFESLMHLYNTDRLEVSKSKKIAVILSREIEKWYTSLDTALKSIHSDIIPKNIFITIDHDAAPLFSLSEKLGSKCSMGKVVVIDGSTFFSQVRPEQSEYRDPFIMIESLAVTRFM